MAKKGVFLLFLVADLIYAVNISQAFPAKDIRIKTSKDS